MQMDHPPPDVPHEKFDALAEQFVDRCRKLGLYVEEMNLHYHVEESDDPDQPPIPQGPYLLGTRMKIGGHAFSKDVQDPEAAQTDVTFGAIVEAEGQSDFDAIRDSYLKKDKREKPEDDPPDS